MERLGQIALVLTMWQMAEVLCLSQICKLGYEFWESEKEVCRHCSDFKDYCWQDVNHIANCSTYCKGLLPKPEPCDNNKDLYIYIPTGISIFVICIVLIPVIVKKVRTYIKLKNSLKESISSLNDDKEEEPETCLLKTKEDQDLKPDEGRSAVPNGFVPLNQIPVTVSNSVCHDLVTSGTKYLQPRSGECKEVHDIV